MLDLVLVHLHDTGTSDSKVSVEFPFVLEHALAVNFFKVQPVDDAADLMVSHDVFQIFVRVQTVAAESAAFGVDENSLRNGY